MFLLANAAPREVSTIYAKQVLAYITEGAFQLNV